VRRTVSTLLSIMFAAIYLSKVVGLGLATVRKAHDRLSATRPDSRALDRPAV
jgi:hypothetical protein